MVLGTQTLVSVTLTIVSHPKHSIMFGKHGFPTGTELIWENIVRGSQTMIRVSLTRVSGSLTMVWGPKTTFGRIYPFGLP